ncbi:MAG TPA: FAD-dependent oxidoreductase [Candidatus Limnocylindrales bacterium]|nr:FAD-dependent oxidoreductase [Candidatus Limnocylindrales bacterium]
MVEGGARDVERVEAVVIGGGVVGCAVLLELALRGVEALLVEAENDLGEGTSKANSAILHTGFDAKPGTIEARLLRRSAERWPGLLEDLGVPSLACGALMLARSAAEATGLAEVAALARAHGVRVELVDGPWLRDAAPYVTPAAVGALHIPDEGIVDPFWLTRAYAEAAIGLGARVRTRARVTGLAVDADAVRLALADGATIVAGHAFDAAGLRADEVAALAGDTSISITPRKGEFLVSERTAGVDRIVLPIPGPLGKGMLVTPIVFGGVLLGPTAVDGTDKTDRSTSAAGRAQILESCRALVPAVDEMIPIRSFAGLRPVSSTGDYVIRPSAAGDRLTLVAGIRSTGISASPGIAEAAVDVAAGPRRWGVRRPGIRPSAAAPDLAAQTGAIVCPCRSIGEAEVAAALASPTSVATTDALKRRCGVGFGDCQGNQCGVDAIGRIAAARGLRPEAVEKGAVGSWLVAAEGSDVALAALDGIAPAPPAHPLPVADRTDWSVDVLIIGGGMSGIGAALALADGGRTVAVVDRRSSPGGALRTIDPDAWTAAERSAVDRFAAAARDGRIGWIASSTVVALDRDDGQWRAEIASARAVSTAIARDVVLASGGYVMPREHSVVDGPRPSGVMTADFVADALDRGWRPARRAVVVGSGRLAIGVRRRLEAAGIDAELVGADPAGGSAVSAIRGQPRLEAVAIDAEWRPADGLVLADRLQPATFLLRGLALGDERPGIPAPVDATGALALPGLWAAGTCVTPDIDHTTSLAAGTAIAGHVLAATGAQPARA